MFNDQCWIDKEKIWMFEERKKPNHKTKNEVTNSVKSFHWRYAFENKGVETS